MTALHFLKEPTRNLFFTGKGGVGKTTTASAAAIALADRGLKVLLVSTDPASNLDEVLEIDLSPVEGWAAATGTVESGPAGLEIPAVPGLWAMNIDPVAAAAAYRERVVGPYREKLPAAAIESIEEQLSGACTVEIAAFDEFAKLLGSPAAGGSFDHIVFDTAPTGHTLRLLELPAAWTDFLNESAGGTSCLGPLSGLGAQRELYANARAALADPGLTTIIVVSRPDESALAEAARASAELTDLDIMNQTLLLNGLFAASDSADAVAVALADRCRQALDSMPEGLAGLPRTELPLSHDAMLGVDSLRRLVASGEEARQRESVAPLSTTENSFPSLDDLVTELAAAQRGVIMTLGKGGVGKTTLAAAIALRLVRLGHPVHLTTTDPAAHVGSAVGVEVAGLTISRIDPQKETEAYADEVLATAGANLGGESRALLEEDLRSPCTEEIAVFRAFANTVAQGLDGFVIIDTAPTGHTLLLLDATEAYHRQVSRTVEELPESVRRLLPRLRDPDFTRTLVVTLAEATPVHEASALQDDLRRAGIEPYAWIINQSLLPLPVSDPVLAARRDQEARFIAETERLAGRIHLVPWLASPI